MKEVDNEFMMKFTLYEPISVCNTKSKRNIVIITVSSYITSSPTTYDIIKHDKNDKQEVYLLLSPRTCE